MTRDYGLHGAFVARANEMQRIEQQSAERAEQAKRDDELIYGKPRTPLTPAEAAAARDKEYARQQAQRDELAARDMRIAIKRRYMAAAPGATEEQFERAYPGLLEEHRRRVALGGDTEIEEPAGSFANPDTWGL